MGENEKHTDKLMANWWHSWENIGMTTRDGIAKNMSIFHLPLLIFWLLALMCSRATTKNILIRWGFLQALVALILTWLVVKTFYSCTKGRSPDSVNPAVDLICCICTAYV